MISDSASSPSYLPPVGVHRSQLESLLLVCDEPTSAEEFARLLDIDEEQVQDLLQEIAQEFDDRGSGFELREHDKQWRLYTRRANASIVETKILDGSSHKLSRAALESLAVVAYKQPVTRSQVAAIRGVNVDGVMRTLTVRGLIAETGESGGAHLYSTTELFLELMGISSLSELPNLTPLFPEIETIELDI